MKRTVTEEKPGFDTAGKTEAALSFDAVYPQSPERVWKALTDPKALSRWFLPGDFEPRMGFRFQFEMGRRSVQGEVIAADREKRLAYKWQADDEPESVVTWTLEPTSVGGTHVHLEHTEAVGTTMLASAAGWSWGHVVTRALPQVLASAGQGRRGLRLSARRNRIVLATQKTRVKFLSIKGRIGR